MAKVLREGTVLALANHSALSTRDGRLVPIEDSAAPIMDAFGAVAGAVLVFHDVTDKRRALEALRESEERQRLVLQASAMGTFEVDLESGAGRWNAMEFELLGLEDGSVDPNPESFFRFVHPDDLPLVRAQLGGGAAGRDAGRRVPRHPRRRRGAVDGRPGAVHLRERRVWRGPRPGRALPRGQLRHHRPQAGRGGAASERGALPRAGRGAAPDRLDGRRRTAPWTGSTTAGATSSGRESAARAGPGRLSSHPADLPLALERWRAAIQTGGVFESEVRLRGHDGELRWFLVRAWPLRDAHGAVIRWFGTHTDVHALKEAERAVRESREDLDHAQAVAHIGSWRLDVRRNELLWSDESWRIFGVPRGTPLTYETFLGTVHPDDRGYVDARWTAALRGEPYDIEHRIVAGDRVSWVRERAELEVDDEGRLRGGFGTTQDITERKQAEERLRAALREKEVLLKEIHHRVKNNLQIIASMLNLQLGGLTDPAVREPLLESQNRVRTLALIHEQLYGSRDLTRIPARTYLAELVHAVHQSFASPAGRVRLELDLEDVELEVDTAIPVALISNELLSNAFKHAFPDGREGRLEVSLRRVGNGRLELCVADDGVGLPPDLDFRTTATLGMQLVMALTTQLQGRIELHREGGARFLLEFRPAAAAER